MECTLERGDLLRLAGGSQGVALRCLRGTLWLTQGDGVDYLVQAGNSFSLAAGVTALVEGLESAEFRLADQTPSPAGAAALTLRACRGLRC